jgi:hypothetical protein
MVVGIGSRAGAHDPSGQTPAAASADRLGGMSSAPSRCIATVRGPAARFPFGGFGSPLGSPGRLRRKSDHEGGRSPWKERATRCPKGCRTQRTRSQSNTSKSRGSLGPCYFRRPATGSGERDHPRVFQRHGGIGRGDTVRLWAGGTLRRVNGVAGSEALLSSARWRTTPVARRSVSRERVSAKRGEPHDRQRGATNPRTSMRRKPSGWCKTTRAERELDGWCRRPEGVSGQLGALGVDALKSCRWRGNRSRTPREEGPRSPV